MRNHIYLLLLPLLFAFSCTSEKSADQFEIQGKIVGYAEGSLFFEEELPEGNTLIDSAMTDAEGNFTFRSAGKDGQIVRLRANNNQSVSMVPQFDVLKVQGIGENLSEATVTGNGLTRSFIDFHRKRMEMRKAYLKASQRLKLVNRKINMEAWRAQEARADNAVVSYRAYVHGFMDTISHPVLAMHAAKTLNPEGNFYFLQQYLDGIRESHGDSPWFGFLRQRVEQHGSNIIGFATSDFTSVTDKGDSLALHSLRGKPVYLYVWASYCEFSRRENERLASFLKAHPDPGMHILTYSIDEDDAAWRQALEEDKMDWGTHVRGIGAWSSMALQQFYVTSVPTTFWLDSRSIIRSKNVRAADLERDFTEIMAKWNQ